MANFVFDEKRNLVEIVNAVYPVGSIKISIDNVNPSTYFPGTTWVNWAKGRVPVGVDTTVTQFNTPNKTGGSLEVPPHEHKIKYVGDTPPVTVTDNYIYADGRAYEETGTGEEMHYMMTAKEQGDIATRGEMHVVKTRHTWEEDATVKPGVNNPLKTDMTDSSNSDMMPPYVTCYYWRRTA